MKEIIYSVEVDSYATCWYLNGKLHRTNRPATEWSDGYKSWHINGNLHRTDGPAVVYADSDKYWYWYLNGKRYDPNNKIFRILSNSNCFRPKQNIMKEIIYC